MSLIYALNIFFQVSKQVCFVVVVFFNLDFRKTFSFESPSWLSKSYSLSTFLHYGDEHETELGEEKCVKSLKAFTNSSSKYFALLKMLLTCSCRSKGLGGCLAWNFISVMGRRNEARNISQTA